MSEIKSFSVVVPCYNEEKNIPLIFNRFEETLNKVNLKIPIEVILVNNGSEDNSAQVMEEEIKRRNDRRFKIVTIKKNIGYGYGIIRGLKAAEGEVLAWTHADMQTDPTDVFRALIHYLDHYNKSGERKKFIVKGRRVNRKLGEWLFTLGMSCIASSVLKTLLHDINAQPKLFHKYLFNSFKSPPYDFSLDLYLLYNAKMKGYSIKTIDVNFAKRIHGQSKWAFSFSSKYRTIMRTIKYIFVLKGHVKKEA